MGHLPKPTPEMGEYSLEIRAESFYLRGEDGYDGNNSKRHGIIVYKHNEKPCALGTAEILLEDIPKIRAALDQVERHQAGSRE
jgi:hypothetical protein